MTRTRWQRSTLARGLRLALLCLAPLVAFGAYTRGGFATQRAERAPPC